MFLMIREGIKLRNNLSFQGFLTSFPNSIPGFLNLIPKFHLGMLLLKKFYFDSLGGIKKNRNEISYTIVFPNGIWEQEKQEK